MSTLFKFPPFWGERLIVEGPGGSFVLELPTGLPTACLPPEEESRQKGPPWVRSLWPELHSELQEWCDAYDVGLRIEEGCAVFYGH